MAKKKKLWPGASVWHKLLQPGGFQLEKPSLKFFHFLHFMCTHQCLCSSNNPCLHFVYGVANASSVWKTGSSLRQSSQNGIKGPQQHLSLGLSSPSANRTLQQSGKPLQWLQGDRTSPWMQFGTLCSEAELLMQQQERWWSIKHHWDSGTEIHQKQSLPELEVNSSWWLCFSVCVW